MLISDVERYLALRQKMGFKLLWTSRHLRAFAGLATANGDSFIRSATAVAWATKAGTQGMRHQRLNDLVRLARFLHAENADHEIPPNGLFATTKTRPAPYIYTDEELARIVRFAGKLDVKGVSAQQRQMYAMLFGLIAATGLRISEAFNIGLDDLLPGGIIRIRDTKFGKSWLIPLHASVVIELNHYLIMRGRQTAVDDHVFLSGKGKRLSYTTVNSAFRRILSLAGIASGKAKRPRIHDLRHSFATRVLEQCAIRRESVSRHFVALSTYMGHSEAANTYWYFQATPQLMAHIAAAGEALVAGEVL